MFQMTEITVDDAFVRFGDRSVAINKINSIEVRSETAKGSSAYRIWWTLAALLALGALGGGAWGALVIVALFAFLGWRSWKKRAPVTTYGLFLVTSSGEAQACATTDGDQIRMLRDRIERAMAKAA